MKLSCCDFDTVVSRTSQAMSANQVIYFLTVYVSMLFVYGSREKLGPKQRCSAAVVSSKG